MQLDTSFSALVVFPLSQSAASSPYVAERVLSLFYLFFEWAFFYFDFVVLFVE